MSGDAIRFRKLRDYWKTYKRNKWALLSLTLITFLSILVVYLLFLKDHKKLQTAHNKHILFLALGLVLYLTFAKLSTYIVQSANQSSLASCH